MSVGRDVHKDGIVVAVASAVGNRQSDNPPFRHAVSGRVRNRIKEVFGWTKTAAGFRKTHHRGVARVGWMFTLTATA